MSCRCNICIEEDCGGKKGCNCETCKVAAECPRYLGFKPTLRITKKCTQHCIMCCFSCSPKSEEVMTYDMALKVADFYKNNGIIYTQIMGGECFLNPDWEKIIRLILPLVKRARIVTNGDWAVSCPEFAEVISEYPQAHVAISNDEWHTNKNIKAAEEACKKLGIDYKVANEDLKEDGIVPVGNGDLFYGTYSVFSCWCHKPDRKYNFLITEDGKIWKCDMGVWDYANVEDYVSGGFDVRFKEFNQVFYKQFIGNCKMCNRACKRAAQMDREGIPL